MTIKLPETRDFADAGKDMIKPKVFLPALIALIPSVLVTLQPLACIITIAFSAYIGAVWAKITVAAPSSAQ